MYKYLKLAEHKAKLAAALHANDENMHELQVILFYLGNL